MLHFGARCHQIVTKTFESCDRAPLGIETCMRVAHGHSDRRMPEQLLDCHYIHSSFQEPGCKRVSRRMPRHAFDSGLSARQSKTRLQINEWFPGFVVIENCFLRMQFKRQFVGQINRLVANSSENKLAGCDPGQNEIDIKLGTQLVRSSFGFLG